MYYNVAQLLKEPVGSTRTYSIDDSVPTGEGSTYISTQGQLYLMRTDRGIWLNASLDAQAPATCSRCLKRFPNRLGILMEEEFFPTMDVTTGQSLRVPERADGSFTIDRRHILDLSEAVRQHFIASQPMKPLCRPDCLGLCPTCGTDRNEDPCSCNVGASDLRWAALQKLQEGNRL